MYLKLSSKDYAKAIEKLLNSIIMKETALANFINSEVDKIQKIFSSYDLSAEEAISYQNSIALTVNNVIKIQRLLQFKLEKILDEDNLEGEYFIEKK